MARDDTTDQPPRRLSLVQPAQPPAPLPPTFPVHARIRFRSGDELVDVREIVVGHLPEGTLSGPVQLLVGDAQPVVLSGELQVRPDGSAVVRPLHDNPNRSAFRVAVSRPVVVEREYGRGTLECSTTNLSVVGALLDAQSGALRRGERVTLTIALPAGAITLRASVVFHEDDERAVRFDDPPPEAEAALSHFLSELQRQALARRP
jgi:hypothetical protein